MELKIIEPISKYIKEFNTPEEFNLFYTKNKEEIDNLTTHKLNKMYHIFGYRITKIKGVLMLKKWVEKKEEENLNEENQNEEIYEQIEILKEEVFKLKNTLNKLIDFINNGK